MQLRNNPCRYCVDERYQGCHAKCEKYIKAKQEHEELMAKIREDSHIKEYMADSRHKRNKRYMK